MLSTVLVVGSLSKPSQKLLVLRISNLPRTKYCVAVLFNHKRIS